MNQDHNYVVSTPTRQVRRKQQHMVPIPLQTDVPTTESQLQRNQPSEFERMPVQTRYQTGSYCCTVQTFPTDGLFKTRRGDVDKVIIMHT